jgi:cell division protease FtsH
MGDELMVFYNEDTESGRNPFLGRSIAMGAKYSDKTKELFDKEVLQLLRTSFDDALDLLSANKDKIDELVLLLIEKRIIGEEEIQPFIEKKCDITIK